MIDIDNHANHIIIQKETSGDSVFEYGLDLSMFIIENKYAKFGLLTEFAKINIAGEGVGYGILGTLFPESFGLDYKFQLRHLFNSFIPTYFDSYYDAFRSIRAKSVINYPAKMAWYGEFSKYFDKKMGISLAYDEIFDGYYRPHIYIKFFSYEVLKRFNVTLKYDRFGFEKLKHLSNVENLDSLFHFEMLYGITKHVEVGVSYRKGFIIVEDPDEYLKKLVDIRVHTSVLF